MDTFFIHVSCFSGKKSFDSSRFSVKMELYDLNEDKRKQMQKKLPASCSCMAVVCKGGTVLIF